jgi:hypothetical protein
MRLLLRSGHGTAWPVLPFLSRLGLLRFASRLPRVAYHFRVSSRKLYSAFVIAARSPRLSGASRPRWINVSIWVSRISMVKERNPCFRRSRCRRDPSWAESKVQPHGGPNVIDGQRDPGSQAGSRPAGRHAMSAAPCHLQ